jgi:hypothetical protein
MTASEGPAACSLAAGQLERRLAAIAEIGSDSLLSQAALGGGRHRLRFRRGAETRRRLERLLAAEAECCSFLELRVDQEGDALVLTIAAPESGRAVADGLAEAFASPG